MALRELHQAHRHLRVYHPVRQSDGHAENDEHPANQPDALGQHAQGVAPHGDVAMNHRLREERKARGER